MLIKPRGWIGGVLSAVFLTCFNSSVMAASKSVTITISCEVVPIIQLASVSTTEPSAQSSLVRSASRVEIPPRTEFGIKSDKSEVAVYTNLEGRHELGQTQRQAGSQSEKLYTLTAL